MNKWTPSRIQAALKILRDSSDYQEALSQIGVSRSALRHAFKSRGFDTPTSYLKNVDPPEEGGSEEEDDEDFDAEFTDFISEENYAFTPTHVLVYTPKKFYKIGKEDFEKMHYDYSNMIPGGSLTINQLCKKYGIRRSDFIKIKTACRWTHDNDPYTDEKHSQEDAASLANDLIQKHRQSFEVQFRKKEVVELKKDAENWKKVVAFLGGEGTFTDFQVKLNKVTDFKNFCDSVTIERCESKMSLEGAKGDRVLVIPVSDIHAGKTYKPDPLSGHLEINKEVLKARLVKITKYIEEEAKKSTYDRVVYLSLGDDFESLFGNMRDGMLLSMDMHTTEQYRFVLDFHTQLLKTVSRCFPKAKKTAIFQGGNHDRLFRSKEWNSESLVTYIVVDRIQQEFKQDEINFCCGRPVMSISLQNGTNLISQHGHVGKVSSEKDIVNYVALHGDKRSEFYLVIQAHLHKLAFQSVNNIKYLINPSVCGPDDYSHYHINKSAPAEFVMIASHPDGNRLMGPFPL